VSWRGVISALDPAARYRSRIAIYHHPLAGRPLIWHAIAAMTAVDPAPDGITVLYRSETSPLLPPQPLVPISTELVEPGDEHHAMRRAVGAAGMTMLVDGRAPLLTPPSLLRLLRAADDGIAVLEGSGNGVTVAVAGEGLALATFDDPLAPDAVGTLSPVENGEGLRIDDRATFTRAGTLMRDRIVRRHQGQGVSFLLPETNWIDSDVTIGADTMLYPGVIVEGMTEIGSECVIGPHCRIVESRIGRGVELKGWNYVTHTSIRNHAVLDPYVRRGYE
jgi:bifunctional N-acetylglucosamine-1-phosphate-uridyltransferase/glucosamine-1-phosphate-acetyltransferase GlmU-like protein